MRVQAVMADVEYFAPVLEFTFEIVTLEVSSQAHTRDRAAWVVGRVVGPPVAAEAVRTHCSQVDRIAPTTPSAAPKFRLRMADRVSRSDDVPCRSTRLACHGRDATRQDPVDSGYVDSAEGATQPYREPLGASGNPADRDSDAFPLAGLPSSGGRTRATGAGRTLSSQMLDRDRLVPMNSYSAEQ